jgi:hypothetical protein
MVGALGVVEDQPVGQFAVINPALKYPVLRKRRMDV